MNKTLKDFVPVLFITIVVCISVSVLVVVDSVTRGPIADQEESAIKKALQEIFPEIETYEYLEDIEVYKVFDAEGGLIGYAFKAIGKGYGGDINIMIGIEPHLEDVTIIAIKILEPINETPGLGALIVSEPWFQDQFQNKPVDDVQLTSDGGEIDAITGATISSKAVTSAIHDTVLEKVELIQGMEGA